MQFKQGISLAAELVAVVSGLATHRKLNRKLLFLLYFVCFAFFTEISINVLNDIFNVNNNLSLLHIYVPIEFLLLSLTYYKYLHSYYGKSLVLVAIIGFELYCLLNPIFFQAINEYTHARSVSSLLLICFSILYFHKVVVEAKILHLSREPMVWINTAVLIYFSGNLFFNLLFSLVLDYSRDFAKLTTWYFGILNVLLYLLISIGFWKVANQKSVA